MYPMIALRCPGHRGYPLLHGARSLFDASNIGSYSDHRSGNSGSSTPSANIPNRIEQATRRHVDAQKEFEKARERYEEAKRKMMECEKKVKEAERMLYYEKHRAANW
ncbi:hypothetical protein yc1106_02850 [Curvularia clavata]|uniref:Uncharacterized protein n=1 Tax=Curvularia clavata TaxID=95742 RepID=A0A9Q9DRN6_CURCL|nr:hypothetical protein yc1106_02850 [Curvularia clavata]